MTLSTLVVGTLEANCYVVGCPETRRGFVIDPGGEPERILDQIESDELEIEYIFNTHGHVDHVAGNAAVRNATGAKILIHDAERNAIQKPQAFWASMVGGVEPSCPDETIDEGDSCEIGTLTARICHTPGHSPGGVCIAVDDALFTGDTLFAGSVGRTDLPGGSNDALVRSLTRIMRDFSPRTRILPGHRGASTLRKEALENPYVQNL